MRLKSNCEGAVVTGSERRFLSMSSLTDHTPDTAHATIVNNRQVPLYIPEAEPLLYDVF